MQYEMLLLGQGSFFIWFNLQLNTLDRQSILWYDMLQKPPIAMIKNFKKFE